MRPAHILKSALLLASACWIFAMTPESVVAQTTQSAPIPRRPVTVALVDKLPSSFEEYPAVVLRRSTGQDIILLTRAAASPEVLDAATRTLLHSRILHGMEPTRSDGRSFETMTLGVRVSKVDDQWMRDYAGRLQNILDQLQKASFRDLPDVGRARALDFSPPSPRRRESEMERVQ